MGNLSAIALTFLLIFHFNWSTLSDFFFQCNGYPDLSYVINGEKSSRLVLDSLAVNRWTGSFPNNRYWWKFTPSEFDETSSSIVLPGTRFVRYFVLSEWEDIICSFEFRWTNTFCFLFHSGIIWSNYQLWNVILETL